jgi:pimeloyl-ACP methyl ester carboxylesterase
VSLHDGRRMNIYCTGPVARGGPTVLLEAGWSNTNQAWRYVQPLIAARTRVCSYDRAGLGFSDPASGARDTAHIVEDLEALLKVAHVDPPYVMVGYSMGGLSARLFADRQGEKVVAMVLVEPSGEGQAQRFATALPNRRGPSRPISDDQACASAKVGSGGADAAATCRDDWPLPASVTAANARIAATPEYQRTIIAELFGMSGAGSEQVAASRRSYGSMPLIVLTGEESIGDPTYTPDEVARFKAVWGSIHAEIAALSARGSHRRIPGASHLIVLEDPGAVAEAVSDAIEMRAQ